MRRGRTFWKNVAKARPSRSIKCFQVCLASCEAKRGSAEENKGWYFQQTESRGANGERCTDYSFRQLRGSQAARHAGKTNLFRSASRPPLATPLIVTSALRAVTFFFLPPKVTHIMMTTAKWIATLLEWDKYRGRVVLFDLFLDENSLSRVKFRLAFKVDSLFTGWQDVCSFI